MISAFEATILGFAAIKPCSGYEVMMVLQKRAIYWAGSAGAVYGAIGRLVTKGMLEVVEGSGAKAYSPTETGALALQRFTSTPVLPGRLILEPALLRIKLRALRSFLGEADRIKFYRTQMEQIRKAQEILEEGRAGTFGEEISGRLADLAIAQLQLEYDFVQQLLEEDLAEEEGNKKPRDS